MNFRKYIAGMIIGSFFSIGVGIAVATPNGWTSQGTCSGEDSKKFFNVYELLQSSKDGDNWAVILNSTNLHPPEKGSTMVSWLVQNVSESEAAMQFAGYCDEANNPNN